MARGQALRGVAVLVSAMLIGLALPAMAGAFPLPTGSSMKCTYVTTGYAFVSDGPNGNFSGWTPTYELQWQLCVVLKDGMQYAKVQLSSTQASKNNNFWGSVTVNLDACYPQATGEPYVTAKTVTRTDWTRSTYDKGSLSGGRYYFTAIATASTSTIGTNGMRAKVVTTGGARVIDLIDNSYSLYFGPGGVSGGINMAPITSVSSCFKF